MIMIDEIRALRREAIRLFTVLNAPHARLLIGYTMDEKSLKDIEKACDDIITRHLWRQWSAAEREVMEAEIVEKMLEPEKDAD